MAKKKEKKVPVDSKSKKKDPVLNNKLDPELIERAKHQQYKVDAERLFKADADSRKRYDWEWLTRDLFRRGYHFSRYNNSTKTVTLASNNRVRIAINLVQAQLRATRNQVTSFRPKWEVMPKNSTEQSVTNARYSGKTLDSLFDKLNLRKMIKDTVTQGLTYSVGGPWEIGFDADADRGEGEVTIYLRDPYDFYIDRNAISVDDAEHVTLAIRRPLDEIKHNQEYKFYTNNEDLRGDMRAAASEYKQFLIQALKTGAPGSKEDDGTVILKEHWKKVRVTEDNHDALVEELNKSDQDSKDLEVGEIVMRVITYVDHLVDPLKVEMFRRDDFPFELYQADTNPLEPYGESWMKHIIPMNRVLDQLESSIYEYHYKYAKGRLVIDKNSGVRLITNRHGDIVEKNPGAEVSALPIAALPNSYDVQINNMRQYIEDIGGAHDISLGRIPTGVKSGVGIAELKAADATNHSDLVDNLEDFLVRVAKKVLREVAENYSVPKMIQSLGYGGDTEHFAVIGEKAAKGRKNDKTVRIGLDTIDLAVIGAENNIRVSIGSWLAYTKSAQQDKLKELFEAGIIDQETFLQHAEFSDVQNIIEKTRKEKLLEQYRKSPAQEGMPTDEEIAEQENIMMVDEGKTPEAEPTDNHLVHLAIHQEHADHPIVDGHMAQHEAMLKQQRSQAVTKATGLMPQPPMMEEPPMGQPGAPMGELPAGPVQAPQQGLPEEQAVLEAMQGVMG